MLTKRRSAGLLMFRRRAPEPEYFLVHPGGPFWAKKDLGAWSIPKGEYDDTEPPLTAAIREFNEETGFTATGEFISLGQVRQPGGKLVTAWAFEGDCDETQLRSNTFSLEWPPRSGRVAIFPEVDRGAWFPLQTARTKILKGQLPLLNNLADLLSG